VASSDPNIVYVGTGEGNPRNNASIGDGMYKSVDGGEEERAAPPRWHRERARVGRINDMLNCTQQVITPDTPRVVQQDREHFESFRAYLRPTAPSV